MKKTVVIIIIAGLALAANQAIGSLFSFGSSKTIQESRVLTLDMAELSTLKAEVGAGQLVIQGDKNVSEIKVFADLQYKEDDKDKVVLFLKQRNGEAFLKADYDRSGWSGNDSMSINLKIVLPAATALKLDDGSGDIKISGTTNSISINDGSGNIAVSGTSQPISINDGSGNIAIDATQADVSVDDGSGNIQITGAQNIVINDGSGNINATNINGTANINDGSGNITLTGLKGGSINDGSGNIRVENNRDMLSINDGSGDIYLDDDRYAIIASDGSGSVYVNGNSVSKDKKHQAYLK